MRTALFDLDGTLADTSADLITAANACFSCPMLDPVVDMATAFKGGRAMLRVGFERLDADWSEADVDRQFPHFLEYYDKNIHVETKLYDGVEAALDHLADSWALGVCTNKPEALAEKLLRSLGIRDRFSAMIGADTLATRKPDAAPVLEAIARAKGDVKRAVLIGDTITDREAARAAGIKSVLITFGPDGDAVRNLAPEALVGSYDELPRVLEGLAL